jgi:SAM-dependent methyltransferase
MKDGMNQAQIEHWNGPEAQRWVELQDRYDRQLEPFADVLLDVSSLSSSATVLDIGCGCGATTRRAARRSERAVGVDISGPMLERARATAASEGVTNVEFLQADVQTHAFDVSFACAISRFDVMFFDDPQAAFVNVASALEPAGRLAFISWQELARNDWLLLPGLAAAQYLPLPEPSSGPGPFSLADRHALDALLQSGFTDIDIASHEVPMLLGGGGTIDETLAFLLNSGMARAMFDGAAPADAKLATAAARKVLEEHQEEDGVRLGAASWVVTARRDRISR